MAIQLQLGLDAIQSYKRLSYTAWHAIAELVDNATQSYFNNQASLDETFAAEGERLTVRVIYDRNDGGTLRVFDNAMGMSHEELTNALIVGFPPENPTGRSQYGMGMKTSACWIGNTWTITTKKLGEPVEHRVEIDVDTVSSGMNDLPHSTRTKPINEHYTVIEIRNHNRVFRSRTLGKIRSFLCSMYRQDLRDNLLRLEWQDRALEWDDSAYQFLSAPNGDAYKKDFNFDVRGRHIHGWVGILDRGSRTMAGFSIFQHNRVIRGWPDSWRPESLFGQFQGTNDLINQRLIGEIHLDGFQVSHTKDGILWRDDDEDEVQDCLKEACNDYAIVAQQRRKRGDDDRGPSETETQAALDEFIDELAAPEFADAVSLETIPPPEIVAQAFASLTGAIGNRQHAFRAQLASLEVIGYLIGDGSVFDPYIVVDSTDNQRVVVTINTQHPHWSQLEGSEGVLNYLRHCTFDAIAEWKAWHQASRLDPDTIKILKDQLLRLPLAIEMHRSQDSSE